MQYNTLGTTNLEVSKICMGTMVFGNGYKGTDQTAYDQLDMALDHGVNFFDTAELYAVPPEEKTHGNSERIVGKRMQERGNRDQVIIATKVVGPNTFSWLQREKAFSKASIREAVEGSLKRLQTEYIDLYQLHWPQRPVALRGKMNFDDRNWDAKNQYEADMIETLEVMKELQDAGKVRHFGLSNETPWGAMKFLELAEKHNLPRMQSIQNVYHLNNRQYEIALSEVSLHENIGLLAYSPLAGGVLTGKYQGGKQPENARYTTRGKDRMPQNIRDKSVEAVDKYIALAQDLGITVTQLALAWINDRNFVTSNIIGSSDTEQLAECLSSAEITLTPETYAKIDEIFSQCTNPGCW